jgi:uncharacterized membrane protein
MATSNSGPAVSSSAKRNVQTIANLENAALHQRSLTDRISDAVTRFVGSGWSVALHVLWFTTWLAVNSANIVGFHVFDPYPYTLLTMGVSLEAIFLSIFVLISQNRMTRQAERRAHLDLQVNLLAEQENTMMLRMLRSLCEHAGIQPEVLDDEVRSLFDKTDLHGLMRDLQKELPES